MQSETPIKGFCRLCRKTNVEMHGDSHIIPLFMLKRMRRGIEFPNPFQIVGRSAEDNLFIKYSNNKGDFEKNIFCIECEAKLGVLDDYGAKYLDATNGMTGELVEFNRERYLKLSGLNYTKLKLFILSIFVRVSHSTLEIFKYKLEKVHENKLSDMIVNDDAGSSMYYPVLVWLFKEVDNQNYSILTGPFKSGKNCHMFSYGNRNIDGMLFSFYTNADDIKEIIQEKVLKEDGTMLTYMMANKIRDAVYQNIIRMPIAENVTPSTDKTIPYGRYRYEQMKKNIDHK